VRRDGGVAWEPDSAAACRCPDGSYDAAALGVHLVCWPAPLGEDGFTPQRHREDPAAMPWELPANARSRPDVEAGRRCVACPACLECDGGFPRLRAGYNTLDRGRGAPPPGGISSGDSGAVELALLRPPPPSAAGGVARPQPLRHVYRCPQPFLCLGEVGAGCDVGAGADCTPRYHANASSAADPPPRALSAAALHDRRDGDGGERLLR
jgi:hypothetical protein